MSARILRGLVAATVAAAFLAACGEAPTSAPRQRGTPPPSIVVQPPGGPRERLLDGRVEGIDQTTVRAQASGRVASIVHDVSDVVAAGNVVLRLRGVEQRAGLVQAESGLREALAREGEIQQRYRRIADLYARKVVAKAAFDEVTAARDAAVARVAAARAARESAQEGVAYADVAAPFSGTVAARHVQPGDLVVPGQALFDVVSPRRLRVVVDVPQALAAALRSDRRASVLREGQRIEADGVTVFAAVAPEAGTVRAWIDLPTDVTGLLTGQFVRVALPAGGVAELSVPVAAVIERSEMTAVYVVAPDGSVALRQVRLGHRRADTVEVLAGLAPGERLVTDPLAAMRALADTTGNPRP